jgi:hypothetical protein
MEIDQREYNRAEQPVRTSKGCSQKRPFFVWRVRLARRLLSGEKNVGDVVAGVGIDVGEADACRCQSRSSAAVR